MMTAGLGTWRLGEELREHNCGCLKQQRVAESPRAKTQSVENYLELYNTKSETNQREQKKQNKMSISAKHKTTRPLLRFLLPKSWRSELLCFLNGNPMGKHKPRIQRQK